MKSIRILLFAFPFILRKIRWSMGDRSPISATLKLTTQCNLSCKHCPWLKQQNTDMPTEQWKDIIQKLQNRGVKFLVFEGGEPTLREDLQELIEFGQSLGMLTLVVTNCTHSLRDYSPEMFLISLDGLQEEHDILRGKGTFDLVLKNLPTTNVHKRALISLSHRNIHQLEAMLDFFAPLVDSFWFSFVYDYQTRESNAALHSEEKKVAALKIVSLWKKYPIANSLSYLKKIGSDRPCRDWLLSTVTSDGTVHSGCMIATLEQCRCEDCELACHRELSDTIYSFWKPSFFRNWNCIERVSEKK
ncbi:MAG: radical SAM protein [Candidatus Electrothrix sp. AW3_4]|nr:radical SAM protein [Candidatus Electrothrix gigas]